MKTFSDIIRAFGSVREFAGIIDAPIATVNSMEKRNAIDVKHWPKIEDAAKARGIAIDRYVLVDVQFDNSTPPTPKRRSNGPRPAERIASE